MYDHVSTQPINPDPIDKKNRTEKDPPPVKRIKICRATGAHFNK